MTTAFAPDRVASGVAIKVEPMAASPSSARNRPVIIALFGQVNAAVTTPDTTKRRIYSAAEVAAIAGYGSPAHLKALELFPEYGGGVGDIEVWWFPLDQPTSGDAAEGTITPSISGGTPTKAQEYAIKISGILSERFTVDVDDTVATICDSAVAAINAVPIMPVIATDNTTAVGLAAKWEGTTGNHIEVELIEYQVDSEVSCVIVQPTGGTGIPDITAALAQIGEQWVTHIDNQLDYTDSTELNEYMVFGQGTDGDGGRRLPEVHKPLVVITGTTEPTVGTVTAVTDARTTDRVNVIATAPGSNALPFVVASAYVREIAKVDNADPAYAYNRRPLTGIEPGTDAEQWTSAQRNAAVKAGCSTVKLRDGVLQIEDVVTCYHPSGESDPIYRYVVNQAKHATIINELDLMVEENSLMGRPIVQPGQKVTNPNAISEKVVQGMLYGVIDRLGAAAIITNLDYAKEHSKVTLSSTNANRLNILLVAHVSGNAKVLSMNYMTGPYYGG